LNDLSYQGNYSKTGIPQLIRNPYSWTTVANILVVDNPPPVGFSYCTPIGPTGNGTSCGNWNDSYVAQTNFMFLTNWFQQFPEYLPNPLYITGESYAGIYVPILAREIVTRPNNFHFKGFAVGDGCIGYNVLCGRDFNGPIGVGPYAGPYWNLEFFYGHGQIGNDDYNLIRANCNESALKSGNLTPFCNKYINDVINNVGGFYSYNLYDPCSDNPFSSTNSRNKRFTPPYPPFPGPSWPCPGDALNLWLNLTTARKALNIAADAYFFDGDNGAGFNYTLTEPDLRPFYLNVIQNLNLRVLVYNGDADPTINSLITQDIYFDYFKQNGVLVKQRWRPWTIDGQQWMGGYVQEFEGDFAFLTIRGAGHMVPEFNPPAALGFLKPFLAGLDYPVYNPPSKKKIKIEHGENFLFEIL